MKNISTQQIHNLLNKIWPNSDFSGSTSSGYYQVNCPFHDDSHASAGLNPDDGFFQCFTCGTQYQLPELIKEYYKLNDIGAANKLINNLIQNTFVFEQSYLNHTKLLNNPKKLFDIQSLGISQQVIQETLLADIDSRYDIMLPVIINKLLYGYKYYAINPTNKDFKVKSSKGLPTGLIAPFDLWVASDRITVICEGEKDMLVARSYGLNAITITGGSQALPIGWGSYFKGRNVIIAYDNDSAGITGAKKLADYLYHNGAWVKVLTNWFEVIKNNKEDLTDFFTKYNKSKQNFIDYANNTEYWTQEDSIQLKISNSKMIPLYDCLLTQNMNNKRTSLVQVKIQQSSRYKAIPKYITFKLQNIANSELITEPIYEITSEDMKYIPGLLQSSMNVQKYIKSIFKEAQALGKQNFKQYNDKDWAYKGHWFSKEQIPVYESIIGNYVESEIIGSKINDSINETFEIPIITFQELIAAKVYLVEYTAIPNEFDKRNVILLGHNVESHTNSISKFKVTSSVIQSIDKFKVTNNEEINTKLHTFFNYIKESKKIHHLNYDLWLANELTFNSVLYFKLNNKVTRGTVYTTIIGDTRVGKSELSQLEVALYKQGKFTNAKLSTLQSLVGGSAGVNNTAVKAGILPKNNKGLVVLEELHGLGNDYFEKITEVKSSGKVNINRVQDTLNLECAVRLVEIANPVQNGKSSKVSNFPSGVHVIKELIHAPENIARNDIYIVIQNSRVAVDPYQNSMNINNNLTDEDFQNRIKWAWSRNMEDIVFENEHYIWEQSNNRLTKKFSTDGFAILGYEAYIKVAKLSIALAIILGSNTPFDYSKVFVSNKHVDFIINWFDHIYSNDIMKMDKYVEEQRLTLHASPNDISILEDLYLQYGQAIDQLELNLEISRDLLIDMSGYDSKQLQPLFKSLIFNRFATVDRYKNYSPTPKFRQAVKLINKNKMQENLLKASNNF